MNDLQQQAIELSDMWRCETIRYKLPFRRLIGIERESARIDRQGRLATTRHPKAFGHPLSHPSITLDYAETLLELVTQPHKYLTDLLNELASLHQFSADTLAPLKEAMWPFSMPPSLPADDHAIQIAQFGESASGQLKEAYRRGLRWRYGAKMQCIAGIHINWSCQIPDEFCSGHTKLNQLAASERYLATLRHIKRNQWLLTWLFGSSPIADQSYQPQHYQAKLNDLSYHTIGLPSSTSLRLSPWGYYSKYQNQHLFRGHSFNDFLQFMRSLCQQVEPDFEKIPLWQNHTLQQLSTHILQIESEYYDSVRLKFPTRLGTRLLRALSEHGVTYLELRLLDIDPFSPLGISPMTLAFIDAFLFWCWLQPSPLFGDREIDWINQQQQTIIHQGQNRKIRLQKHPESQPQPVCYLAESLCQQMKETLANWPDSPTEWLTSIDYMLEIVRNKEETASERHWRTWQQKQSSFIDWGIELSARHAHDLQQLDHDQRNLIQLAQSSWREEQLICQRAEQQDFKSYWQQYMQY